MIIAGGYWQWAGRETRMCEHPSCKSHTHIYMYKHYSGRFKTAPLQRGICGINSVKKFISHTLIYIRTNYATNTATRLYPNVCCPFRAQGAVGAHIPQGGAIGLGYVGLSVRQVAMKNGCDRAKCPAYIPAIALQKVKCPRRYNRTVLCALKGLYIPAQWHRLGENDHHRALRPERATYIRVKARCGICCIIRPYIY
jgi:hypothetical protein